MCLQWVSQARLCRKNLWVQRHSIEERTSLNMFWFCDTFVFLFLGKYIWWVLYILENLFPGRRYKVIFPTHRVAIFQNPDTKAWGFLWQNLQKSTFSIWAAIHPGFCCFSKILSRHHFWWANPSYVQKIPDIWQPYNTENKHCTLRRGIV